MLWEELKLPEARKSSSLSQVGEGRKLLHLTSFAREFFLDVLRKLRNLLLKVFNGDSIPDSLRQTIRLEEGLDWDNTQEQYVESWERKQQRIALSIMTLIGSSPDRIINFG